MSSVLSDLPRSVFLRGSAVSHVPDERGFPACRSASLPPVYAVVRGLPVLMVPAAHRCTADGCAQRWSKGSV